MKRHVCLILLILALLAAPAFADAPATGLDALAPLLPGTWKGTGEVYQTEYTKAGQMSYVSARDCWLQASELKCVFVVNKRLELYAIFTLDAGNGIYHETQFTHEGESPVFNIYVKGNTWTYLQDGEDKGGNVYHTRIVKTYVSPTHVDITTEYSVDNKTWVLYQKATETRIN